MANEKTLIDASAPELSQIICLSALNIFATNIHQLSSSTASSAAIELIKPEKLIALKAKLLDCIDKPPLGSVGGKAIAQAALTVFTTEIDIFYPTATQRCGLLIDYMSQYVKGDLSELEVAVLGLLLKRISTPSSLFNLLDEQSKTGKGHASVELFTSILNIARTEVMASLAEDPSERQSASAYAVGRASVQMLSSLTNQLLSQTVQSLVVASEKETANKTSFSSTSTVSPDISNTRNDVDMLLELFKSVAETCGALLDETWSQYREGPLPPASPRRLGSTTRFTIIKEHDVILKESPVGALLPLLIFVVMELVQHQRNVLLPSLTELTNIINPLIQTLNKVVDLLPKEKRSVARGTVEQTSKKKVITKESEHNYRSNMDEYIALHMPRAERIVIEFDPRSATENNYDYLVFWKDNSKTERWHTDPDKFHGRNGNQNWPGSEGRPPFVINGDYAYIEWHSDGSNEDWGWKFTATAEFKPQEIFEECHWLLQLNR